MSKHAAEPSPATLVREHVHAAMERIGQSIRAYGTHRADA